MDIKKNKKKEKKIVLKKNNLNNIRAKNVQKLENLSLELQNRKKNIMLSEKDFYYFQIGFNRCATQSLYSAFINCGLKAIHHNFKTSKICFREYLAPIMLDNLKRGDADKVPILNGKLSTYDAFLDMSYLYGDNEFNFYIYFKNMEKQYPGSIFIFNTRDCVSWILSRIKLGSNPTRYNLYYKIITPEKIKNWIDHYFEHSYNVKEYFNKPLIKKRSKLFVYNINQISLKDFCKELNLPNINNIKNEKVDYIKNKQLTEEDKKVITPDIQNYIENKIKINGDPTNINWWK